MIYVLAAIGLAVLVAAAFACGFLIGCVAAIASGRDRTAHDATLYAEGYADGRSS